MVGDDAIEGGAAAVQITDPHTIADVGFARSLGSIPGLRHDDHHRSFEVIAGGDGWRAELLMREHVTSLTVTRLQALRG